MVNQAKITHIKYFVNFKRFLDSVEFLCFWVFYVFGSIDWFFGIVEILSR